MSGEAALELHGRPGFMRTAMGPDGIVLGVSSTARTLGLDTQRRSAETASRGGGSTTTSGGSESAPNATLARQPPQQHGSHDKTPAPSALALLRDAASTGDRSLQSPSQSNPGSQDTTSTQVFTPPESDSSAGMPGTSSDNGPGPSSQDSQLHQLSEIAAAQDKMTTDGFSSRKRMADGAVKGPVRGHSRHNSTASRASTTGSHIGELSSELQTRLSYAMVKVNNGWQGRSLDEVESLASLASHAASPVSSTSTIQRRHSCSASPRHPPTTAVPRMHTQSVFERRPKSNTPPDITANRPTLAPPAPIQPSSASLRPNPRRSSIARSTPLLLSKTHAMSPRSTVQRLAVQTGHLRPRAADPFLVSPHQNVREQDAIETLLFMSSPGNSANMKHAFSPNGSPAPQPHAAPNAPARHALPSGPRKMLPSQRPAYAHKRVGFEKSPSVVAVPGSPMDVDSPQQQYHTPNRGTPRKRLNGGSGHFRGALSLPSGLSLGDGTARKALRDEDVERMLDKAAAEMSDSSDDEMTVPRSRGSVSGIVRA